MSRGDGVTVESIVRLELVGRTAERRHEHVSVLTAPDLAVPPICHLFFREVSKSGIRVKPMRVPSASAIFREKSVPPSNVR